MKKFIALTTLALLTLSTPALIAAEAPLKVGIVNFTTCVTDSKLGKQEQNNLEGLKKQMASLIEDTEKQLKDIAGKLEDKDYVDGLSPEAQQELEGKMRTLSEEMGRYQQQYYQVLQQANYKMLQSVSTQVTAASEKISSAKGFTLILNKDACFSYLPSLDITPDVVKEMNKAFEAEEKKNAAPAPTPEPQPSAKK